MKRRDFIKFVVAGSVVSGCPVDLALLAADEPAAPTIEGEENRICHEVRDGKAFTLPQPSARHDFVIVGGGISGLTAAYLLRNHDFLLLEKEPHWGGNAYLEEYDGSAYATGAAYIVKSEEAYGFSKEIGLIPLPVKQRDGSLIKGEFVPDTWGDGLDKLPYSTSVRESFKKLRKEILAIDLEKRERELLDVPWSKFLEGYPEEVTAWWDAFGPSNWGATTEESAAAVAIWELQDMAGKNGPDDRYTWPGGLGAISKKLTDILKSKDAARMQTGATTIAVTPQKDEVHVSYMLGDEIKTVAAKAVIMTTPKFITRRIVRDIPAKQDEAMQKMRYIPYAVVNLIFDKQVVSQSYDTWCPGQSFTDFVVADWVLRQQPGYKRKNNILTCYTPLHEEERPLLLTEPTTRRVARNVLRDFQKLFPGSNVDPVEVHIYRRGHPLFMSIPGMTTQIQPVARQPMDRIFFANCDVGENESTTSGAITAAQRAVKEAESRLAGKAVAS
jgi:protoporphyrinogen/coproporphyrinogen III oxidase